MLTGSGQKPLVLRSTWAETVIQCIRELFKRYDIPQQLSPTMDHSFV